MECPFLCSWKAVLPFLYKPETESTSFPFFPRLDREDNISQVRQFWIYGQPTRDIRSMGE